MEMSRSLVGCLVLKGIDPHPTTPPRIYSDSELTQKIRMSISSQDHVDDRVVHQNGEQHDGKWLGEERQQKFSSSYADGAGWSQP